MALHGATQQNINRILPMRAHVRHEGCEASEQVAGDPTGENAVTCGKDPDCPCGYCKEHCCCREFAADNLKLILDDRVCNELKITLNGQELFVREQWVGKDKVLNLELEARFA